MHRQLVVSRGRICSRLFASLWALTLILMSQVSLAQHNMHNMAGNDTPDVISMPADDEVLPKSPSSIMLQFKSNVMLVKLAVKNLSSSKEPVDIGFRFSPDRRNHFTQTLPELAPADYYSVEWAVFDEKHALIKGVFHFSFGKDAQPPSFYRNQLKPMQHIMSPDYRLQ